MAAAAGTPADETPKQQAPQEIPMLFEHLFPAVKPTPRELTRASAAKTGKWRSAPALMVLEPCLKACPFSCPGTAGSILPALPQKGCMRLYCSALYFPASYACLPLSCWYIGGRRQRYLLRLQVCQAPKCFACG